MVAVSERLTPERLAELRRIAEAATDAIERALFNNNPDAVRSAERGLHVLLDTLATQAAEIERLRRERETLAAAVRAWDDYAKTIIENGPLAFDAIDAMERAEQRHREALALLDGEKGGGE